MSESSCECKPEFRVACEGLTATRSHGGKRYCILHLPIEDKQSDFDRVLQDRLRAGLYNCRGVFFPEDISWSQAFEADVDFSDATFNGEANFGRVRIYGNALFERTKFNGRASFHRARFFGERTSFEGAMFAGNRTNFDEAEFDQESDFHYARFRSDNTFFSRTTFGGSTDFSRAEFSGKIYFSSANFLGDQTNFYSAKFGGNTFFSASVFRGKMYFSGTEFGGEATSFYRTVFLGEIDFGRCAFGNRVGFHTVNLRPISFVDASGVRTLDSTSVNWVPYGTINRKTEGIDKCDINKEIQCLRAAIEEREKLIEKERQRRRNKNDDFEHSNNEGVRLREEERQKRDKELGDRDRLAKVYRELAISHEENRRYEDAGEFNYRSWDVERSKGGKGSIRQALLNMHWFLSGYWERPWRALSILALMWLLFAVAY